MRKLNIDFTKNFNQDRCSTCLKDIYEKSIFKFTFYDIPQKDYLKIKIQQHMYNEKNKCFSLLFLNIDNLRKINYLFGYDIGDKLIVEIVSQIKSELNLYEQMFRWSGDEFIIVLPYIEAEHINNRLNRILNITNRTYEIDNKIIESATSIGISQYPKDGVSFENIVKKADIAMDFVKKNGKRAYAYFHEDMLNSIEEKINLEIDLRRAILNNEFELHYQPIFSLKSKKIIGVEALIRWNHPKRGFISPMKFIPFAEEIGLIVDIGKWVIKESFMQSKMWQNKGYDNIKVSINISSVELKYPDFLENIKEMLKAVGNNSNNIKVEITETAMMESYKQGIKILKELNNMGIDTSLDDFGTGYSSLSYLRNLPIGTLKIDKSFIDNIHVEESNRDIVKGMVELGHKMNMDIVAEGVELTNQLDILKNMGCDAVQGYFCGRPMKSHDIEILLMKEGMKHV